MTVSDLMQEQVHATDEARANGRLHVARKSGAKIYDAAALQVVEAIRACRRCAICEGSGEIRAALKLDGIGQEMSFICGVCDGTGERDEAEARFLIEGLLELARLVADEALSDA